MASITEALQDITECPICQDVLKDPRTLPCVHTYCFQCIEQYNRTTGQKGQLKCPLCRKQFTLSDNGVQGLPKNFFIERLRNIRGLCAADNNDVHTCEMCSSRESEPEKQTMASVYCVDCEQWMCERCEKLHKNLRAMQSHRSIQYGSDSPSTGSLLKLQSCYCSQHRYEVVKLYCNECQTVLCIVCFAERHTTHRCTDIGKVGEELKPLLFSECKNIDNGITECRELEQMFADYKQKFMNEIICAEGSIRDAVEEIQRLILLRQEALLRKLMTMKRTKLKQLDTLNEGIKHHTLFLKSLQKYIAELAQNGTAGDIARETNNLCQRSKELLQCQDLRQQALSFALTEISFVRSSVGVSDPRTADCLVGGLNVNTTYLKEPAALSRVNVNCICDETFEITWLPIHGSEFAHLSYDVEMRRLSGDHVWIPCGTVDSANEPQIFVDRSVHQLSVNSSCRFRVRAANKTFKGNWTESEDIQLVKLMQIFVKTLEERTLTINVDPMESIKSVKDKVALKMPNLSEFLILITSTGKSLCDEKTLRDYNINRYTTLFCGSACPMAETSDQ